MDNFDNMQLILDIVDLNNALPPPPQRPGMNKSGKNYL